MSRFHRSTAIIATVLSVGLLSSLTTGARAATVQEWNGLFVNGSYHSVTKGIPNYDGFDRFRDAQGQPLPGWEQELRSPG